MASRIKAPCIECTVDREINPFCRQGCKKWEEYELDKNLEEKSRKIAFDRYGKWVTYAGKTGLRKKFSKV